MFSYIDIHHQKGLFKQWYNEACKKYNNISGEERDTLIFNNLVKQYTLMPSEDIYIWYLSYLLSNTMVKKETAMETLYIWFNGITELTDLQSKALIPILAKYEFTGMYTKDIDIFNIYADKLSQQQKLQLYIYIIDQLFKKPLVIKTFDIKYKQYLCDLAGYIIANIYIDYDDCDWSNIISNTFNVLYYLNDNFYSVDNDIIKIYKMFLQRAKILYINCIELKEHVTFRKVKVINSVFDTLYYMNDNIEQQAYIARQEIINELQQ